MERWRLLRGTGLVQLYVMQHGLGVRMSHVGGSPSVWFVREIKEKKIYKLF